LHKQAKIVNKRPKAIEADPIGNDQKIDSGEDETEKMKC
jgi:hypothetical protein